VNEIVAAEAATTKCSRALLRSRERTHGYEICIVNSTDVRCAQRQQSASSTRSCYEFNLDAVRRINFDNRTEIAALESVLWKVVVENDGV
jgi:hypothetical protein